MKLRTLCIQMIAIGVAGTSSATLVGPASSADRLETAPSPNQIVSESIVAPKWERQRERVRRSLESAETPAAIPSDRPSSLRPIREASAIPEPGMFVLGWLIVAGCAMTRPVNRSVRGES